MYKDSIKAQFRLMISGSSFKASFMLLFALSLISYILNIIKYQNTDISQMMSATALFMLNDTAPLVGYLEVMVPIIAVFPFVFSSLDDQELNIYPYIFTRQNRKSYLYSKYIVSIIGGFLILFLPLLINWLLCMVTFPINKNTFWGGYNEPYYQATLVGDNWDILSRHSGLPFLKLYLFSPVLYSFFFIFIASLLSSAFSAISFAFSLVLRKHKIILLLPGFLIFTALRLLNAYIYSLNGRGIPYLNVNLFQYIQISGYTIGKSFLFFFLMILFFFFTSFLGVQFTLRRRSRRRNE